MTTVSPSQVAVLLVAIGLLGVLHVVQHARNGPPGATPSVGQVLSDLAGGRDAWTRGLLITAVVAVSFAAGAPVLPGVAGLVDHLIPG